MDFMKLKATLSLDDSQYERALDESEGKARSFGGAFATAMKVGTAAVIAATTAIVGLTKKSVEAYAEYEQLSGGVKKLYEDGYGDMMQYASEAYKTAGMSANQYMRNVTGFSAALLNSVGNNSKEAARIADMAMQDISDNANTFGKYTAEELAGVYQALAKGQFQTLDNLNLGFGGTKEGMQQLIDKANQLAIAQGEAGDLTIDSYADIVKAIHLVQDDLNITGTTQREAAKTIQGSLEMTKAAWENLLTGFADPDADIPKLMEDVVTSVGKAAENLGPAIIRALEGIGQALTKILPEIMMKIPSVISQYIVPLLNTGIKVVLSIVQGIGQAAPQLIPAIVNGILTMVQAMADNIDLMVNAAVQLGIGIATGLIKALPIIIEKMPEIIASLVEALLEGLPDIIEAGAELIIELGNSMFSTFKNIVPNGISGLARQIASWFKNGASNLYSAGATAIGNLWSGIRDVFSQIPSKVRNLAQDIVDWIKWGLGNLYDIGWDLIAGLWEGIADRFDALFDDIENVASDLASAVADVLGISSPSKVFRDIGKWIPEGLAVGIEQNLDSVSDATQMMADNTLIDPDNLIVESGMDGGSAVTSNMNSTFNIYTQPEQDAEEIAREVEKVLVRLQGQRKAAFA